MMIRNALATDCQTLSEISYKSKSYWNYSNEFLEACKDDLIVTNNDVQEKIARLYETDNVIQGFYIFNINALKLDALFIDPEAIGKGIGRKLWDDLLLILKEQDIHKFTIDSDPNAEPFYLKMGAINIGEIDSSVFPDRKLPLLEMGVN